MHTINSDGPVGNGDGNLITSSTPLKRPISARPRQFSAANTSRKAAAIGPSGSNGREHNSRSVSLSRASVHDSITSISTTRPSTVGRVTSTKERRYNTSIARQRSISRRSTSRLSNGPSLSCMFCLLIVSVPE